MEESWEQPNSREEVVELVRKVMEEGWSGTYVTVRIVTSGSKKIFNVHYTVTSPHTG